MTAGSGSNAGTPIACERRSVDTAYIPNGKTAPQYNGSYFSGKRRNPCRHAPRMTSIGIHHVAVAQNIRLSPLTNGRRSRTSGEYSEASASVLPASAEMATAPMLIQYGGASSEGAIVKNV